MRVAVIGGTGRIGSLTVTALEAAGHDVVAVSRSSGVDVQRGTGLDEALAGVRSVVDVTSTSAQDSGELIDFFTTGTANLLAAEQRAGVRHHVLLSIVNVDAVPGVPHYDGKIAQERLVADGPVPWTIVRATQFHDFPEMVTTWTLHEGTAMIAPTLLQPIAPSDVAVVLAEVAAGDPQGRFDLAGPETQDSVDMARRTYAARGRTIRLVPTWGGPFSIAMAGNALLPQGEARLGTTTFDQWLAEIAG